MTKGNTSLQEALDAGITAQRTDGTITKLLTDAGLSEGLGKVAEKQYVVPAS
jgi:polar amino acid transport system substrate-binding protein